MMRHITVPRADLPHRFILTIHQHKKDIMISIETFLKLFQYKVTESGRAAVDCFGKKAFTINHITDTGSIVSIALLSIL